MPHPSIPLDDIRAHSYNREHGLREQVSRTFGLFSVCAREGRAEGDQRVERSSDGIFFSPYLVRFCVHTCSVLYLASGNRGSGSVRLVS